MGSMLMTVHVKYLLVDQPVPIVFTEKYVLQGLEMKQLQTLVHRKNVSLVPTCTNEIVESQFQ